MTKSGNTSRNENNMWKYSGRFVETLEQVSEMKSHNMHLDTTCSLCRNEDDTIQHYLECSVLVEQCKELYNDRIVRYEDIFDSLKA